MKWILIPATIGSFCFVVLISLVVCPLIMSSYNWIQNNFGKDFWKAKEPIQMKSSDEDIVYLALKDIIDCFIEDNANYEDTVWSDKRVVRGALKRVRKYIKQLENEGF